MEAYRYPDYYDIAFAVPDAAREVDFFAAAIERLSRVPVGRVFEIACGTAPYLEEWHRRGYRYCGLDLSPPMLDNARAKAASLGIAADFVRADMRDFDPGKIGAAELAYVLLGSIYVGSNREFLDHLARVAEVLPAGGLYLLDSVVWFQLFGGRRRGWTRRRGGVTVRMRYRAEIIDSVAQTYKECVTLEVDDDGATQRIEGRVPTKFFFPQEFLCLFAASRFEFMGWFNDFDLDAPVTPQGRHIAILRRL
jgi:SAM-dependent methyltransferase